MHRKKVLLNRIWPWVRDNVKPTLIAGKETYVWDSFQHDWQHDLTMKGRNWKELLSHVRTPTSAQKLPSTIEISAQDFLVYGTGTQLDPDTDCWMSRYTCFATLYTEHREVTAGVSCNPHTRDGTEFLQIQFDCQVIERQLDPAELATYMRFAKHLHWVDQLATCEVPNSHVVHLIRAHCSPKPQVVETKECLL